MYELIATLLAALVPAVVVAVRRWLQVRLSPTQFDTLLNLARTVVHAAEEVGAATDVAGPGKYGIAEQALMTSARRVGLKLKPEEVSTFIHAAVAELHQAQAQQAFVLADDLDLGAAA